MEIVLLKQTDQRLSEADAAIVRRFLFQSVDGCSEKDKKAWRGFWRSVAQSGSGEYFTVTIKRQRSGPFHRLVFVVMQAVFKGQEAFIDFRVFRSYLKMGAGFVDYIPTADGELRAIPKSQSFDDCSEEEIRQFFDDMTAFLRTTRCQKNLWPALSAQVAEQGMETILSQFDKS